MSFFGLDHNVDARAASPPTSLTDQFWDGFAIPVVALLAITALVIWAIRMRSRKNTDSNEDAIAAVGIDADSRLFIKPATRSFPQIWRSAAEVHWDPEQLRLFGARPREWDYADWYQHIVAVVADEYGVKLKQVDSTAWINVSEETREAIIGKPSILPQP